MCACLKHTWMRGLNSCRQLFSYQTVGLLNVRWSRKETAHSSVQLHPLCSPFLHLSPKLNSTDFDLYQHPVHLNGKERTGAALSAILRVAVISQHSLLYPASFCCSNFPNGFILNYEFLKIYIILTYITHSQRRKIIQQTQFFLHCLETQETPNVTRLPYLSANWLLVTIKFLKWMYCSLNPCAKCFCCCCCCWNAVPGIVYCFFQTQCIKV